MLLLSYAIDLDMMAIDLNRVEEIQRFFEHHHTKELKLLLNDLYHLKFHQYNFVDLKEHKIFFY